MRELLIRGGRLVDPASGVDELRDVLLRDGRVAAVDAPGAFEAVEVAETIRYERIRFIWRTVVHRFANGVTEVEVSLTSVGLPANICCQTFSLR